MQIVRAKPEDAAALTQIAHAAKRHWDYPERWIEAWRDILPSRVVQKSRIEVEPQRTRRARKKNSKFKLCVLRVLCGK
jgi:hypothetical protein